MPTKITFAGGAEITLEQDASDVRRRLSEDKLKHGEPFTMFDTAGGAVYVAVDQVACIEQWPAPPRPVAIG
ncbi:MAG: hypothetical protein JWO74_2303 [Solirubrobacterales bacterium]|nr:hypothetical protein [Solirubrobacterales bacterium]